MEPLRSYSGFTLVELLVVLAIISVLAGIILSSQSSFNKTLIAANTAYDVALSLRGAETYGLSSRANGTVSNTGYGLDFERSTPGNYILFADTYPAPSTSSVCHPTSDPTSPAAMPGDCVYEASEGEEVLNYALGNGITIADFCAYDGTWACANSHGSTLSSMDIVFSRPNPDVFISTNGMYSATIPSTAACVTVTSPQGGDYYISVASTGEISANAASCP